MLVERRMAIPLADKSASFLAWYFNEKATQSGKKYKKFKKIVKKVDINTQRVYYK